jgi:hypothetical protein
MTEPSNLIKTTVEGLFKCQSRPTMTGLAALTAGVGLLDDAEAAADVVVEGEPQAPTSSRKTNAEANRNVNMTLTPGKLCRSSRPFELAVISLNGAAAGRLLSLPGAILVPWAQHSQQHFPRESPWGARFELETALGIIRDAREGYSAADPYVKRLWNRALMERIEIRAGQIARVELKEPFADLFLCAGSNKGSLVADPGFEPGRLHRTAAVRPITASFTRSASVLSTLRQ